MAVLKAYGNDSLSKRCVNNVCDGGQELWYALRGTGIGSGSQDLRDISFEVLVIPFSETGWKEKNGVAVKAILHWYCTFAMFLTEDHPSRIVQYSSAFFISSASGPPSSD